MPLRDTFPAALKDAMKAGDKPRVAALRLIQAAIKDREIEARGQGRTIGDEDVLALLQKMVKSRHESLAIYEGAGREDLAAIERGEIAVLGEYLPKAMGEAEVAEAIRAAVAETGAAAPRDMGKVIAALKARHAGRMDFSRVSPQVKAALGG